MRLDARGERVRRDDEVARLAARVQRERVRVALTVKVVEGERVARRGGLDAQAVGRRAVGEP